MKIFEKGYGCYSEDGQAMVEYALIIAIFILAALIVFSNGVSDSLLCLYETIKTKIDTAV